MSKNISIIQTFWNSEEYLDKTLSQLESVVSSCEIVFVDDGSTDNTVEIVRKFKKVKLIELGVNQGRQKARLIGMKEAKGDIVVNVDSDVLVYPDTIEKIKKYLELHPEVDAVTGRLAKEHLNSNFASQYKNLYMNYYFGLLPTQVNFLYGSIFAVRRKVVGSYLSQVKKADDTDLGLYLDKQGKVIHLIKDLEVIHLKKYSLWSLIKNDFEIPYDWAQIFWDKHGWKQLFKNGSGFAHASKGQLGSLIVSALIVVFCLLLILGFIPWYSVFLLLLLWINFNWKFINFLVTEKGWVLGIKSILFTFVDYYVMSAGILWGSVNYLWKKIFL